jgi:hypothetical protein
MGPGCRLVQQSVCGNLTRVQRTVCTQVCELWRCMHTRVSKDGGFEHTIRAVYSQEKFSQLVETVVMAAHEGNMISLACKFAWVQTYVATYVGWSHGCLPIRCHNDETATSDRRWRHIVVATVETAQV